MKHVKTSPFIAIGLIVAVGAWLLSGYRGSDAGNEQPVLTAVADQADEPMRVRIRTQHAQQVIREIVLNGYTAPHRTIALAAETSGRVARISATRGARIKRGDPIIHLKLDDRTARLDQAKALIQQREREYRAAETLGRQGYIAQSKVEEADAALEAAQAELARITVEVTNTVIRAPFDGILHERPAEIGDYVTPGTVVATIVDTDPLIVIGQVAQQHVAELAVGGRGTVHLVTGQKIAGKIRYIAAAANEATRTFTVELVIPNPDGACAAGVSSTIRLPVETVTAHLVSPALLALNDTGVLGVKTVNDAGIVAFHPARIVRTGPQGIWLAGLPATVRLIVVGQGFVHAGERVHPIPADTNGLTVSQHPTHAPKSIAPGSTLAGGGAS